jgi:dipeptidyl aminopeptidase/acylaminoacyl peptidase
MKKIKLSAMKKIFLLSVFITHIAAAQNIELYLSPPFPTDLIASPDGNSIAWVFNDKGSRNIYMAATPAFLTKKVTAYSGDDGMELNSLQFTPDGNQIVFVRGNGINNRGEAANPAFLQTSTEKNIWIIYKQGNNLRKIGSGSYPKISPDGKTVAYLSGGQICTALLNDSLSKPQKLFQSRGVQSQIRWSPDGNRLAFVSNRGDHSFIAVYNFMDKTVRYTETSMDNDTYPVWSADSKQLAYIRIPNINNLPPFVPLREANPWSIRLFNIQTGEANQLWKAAPGKGSVFLDDIPVADNLLWWAAGNSLIFPYEKEGWQHLYALDIEKGTIRLLTPGSGEIENVTLSADKQIIYYTTNISDIDRRHIWKVNISGGQPEILTPGNGIEWSPVITANGIALLHSSASKPPWPAIVQNGKITDLATEFFPKYFPGTLVQPQAIMINATDGMQVTADIFLPPNHKPGDKHPALIFLHGGSRRQMLLGFHYGQYYSNAYALNQYFASQGYVVLSLNYRSGIGYGLEFREALNYGAAGASEVKDLIGAGLYLKGRADVDAKKIALWGGSYGGYLTAHGLAQASDIFACGVDIHGVHNWNDEIPTFALWYDAAKFPAIAQKALESSPVYYLKDWKNPVLLIHGDDDRNVPFSESVNIAELLRKQGVHTEQLVLPDEVHSFLLHRNWLKAYTASFEFIHRQLNQQR